MPSAVALAALLVACAAPAPTVRPAVMPIEEGFVDNGGVLLYFKTVGHGSPLVVVHGGPGASHDYLLPNLYRLAASYRLVFVDERGSGRSPRLEDPHAVHGGEDGRRRRGGAERAGAREDRAARSFLRRPGGGGLCLWGSHGEFVVDGNLTEVEWLDRLRDITVPTLILVGDHDQADPAMSREMNARIAGSRMVVLPNSGHMTFVDQPDLFVRTITEFVR